MHEQAPLQATHVLLLHSLPAPQSLFLEHSTGAPASSVGGVQTPLLQTRPFAQSALVLHFWLQPLVVQMYPAMQSTLLVQEVAGGGDTDEQPYPSQE